MGLLDNLSEKLKQAQEVGTSKLNSAINSLLEDSDERHDYKPSVSETSNHNSSVAESNGLFDPQIEKLIDLAVTDGELSDKEKQVLFKKAEAMGIDLDEFEMVLESKLSNIKTKNSRIQNNSDNTGSNNGQKSNDAIMSSQKLTNAIKEIEDRGICEEECECSEDYKELEIQQNQIAKTIYDFPVPNAKEDLLDFIIFLRSKINYSEHSDAYMSKYNECCEKIKFIFPNDQDFIRILMEGIPQKKDQSSGATLYHQSKGMRSSQKLNMAIEELEEDVDFSDFEGDGEGIYGIKEIYRKIQNFPTPREKSDLLDFMLYLKSQTQNSQYSQAYFNKYNDCVETVNLLYPNDADFNKLLQQKVSVSKRGQIKMPSRFRETISKMSLIMRRIFNVLKVLIIIAIIVAILILIFWFIL